MNVQQWFHSKVKVLFEQDHLIVVDKPAGLLSHPNSEKDKSSTVVSQPYNLNGEFFFAEGKKLFLLHRLDKETSGCLMLSTDPDIAQSIKALFKKGEMQKVYVSLVLGNLKKEQTWTDYLEKDRRQGSSPATTIVKPLENFPFHKLTLVEFWPKTGKTHQLRIQSSKRKTHILGDRLHGDFHLNKKFRSLLGLKRMFLHSQRLAFLHPKSKLLITVESLIPAELQECLELLRTLPVESGISPKT